MRNCDCHPKHCCCRKKKEEKGIITKFVIGNNVSPLPTLSPPAMNPPTFLPLSTLTIKLDDASDTVRFLASIGSDTTNSTIFNNPLLGTVVEYQIIEVGSNRLVARFLNTDFDEATTTFTAFDMPGCGTFTYRLQAALVRNNDNTGEAILRVVFTAEEIEANRN
ncbi:hypothetical protein [Bacillus sp. JJ722]|uniref:hypothetical protein n=1 Tax=Bacillus sp. JJ722 TaxID=3122973 RepID=UPI003000F15B